MLYRKWSKILRPKTKGKTMGNIKTITLEEQPARPLLLSRGQVAVVFDSDGNCAVVGYGVRPEDLKDGNPPDAYWSATYCVWALGKPKARSRFCELVGEAKTRFETGQSSEADVAMMCCLLGRKVTKEEILELMNKKS